MTKDEFIQKFQEYVRENPQSVPFYYTRNFAHRDKVSGKYVLEIDRLAQSLRATALLVQDVEADSMWTFPDVHVDDALISDTWVSGGMSGGSCWHNEGATNPVQAEEEPDFFVELGEAIYPDMPYRLAVRLFQKCEEFEYTVSEYYGNYTDHKFRVLRLQDILDVLFPGE